jgi:hypothetical protein
MAYDPLNDPELDVIKAEIRGADDAGIAKQLTADIGARREAAEHPYRKFVMDLPKNIGIGAWKALVNTVDTASDVAVAMNPQATATKAVGGEEVRKAFYPTISEQYPEFMDSMRNFTSQWERNDTMSDDITQGVTQFALPFMGWLKAAGGLNTATKAGAVLKSAAVEAGTAASAFDPHDGRIADLIDMGRESETKFGTLLRKIMPDGSLANQYIDYMTAREGEGVAEGRWKNAVDAVVSSAAVAGLLKGVAVTHKTTKILVDGALEDLTTPSSFGPKKQKGMVAFHGTPHDFDAFDLSKIGTGEGNQVFGYGLYFAESEGTAKHYRGALARRAFAPGSPMENAYSQMEQSNWDARQAYTVLMQKAARADGEWKDTLINAANKVKAGNVKRLGALMTVDIPDEAVAKMLDYDKLLSEQPDILKKIPAEDRAKLEGMLEDYNQDGGLEDFTGNQLQQMIGRAISEDYISFTPADGNFDNSKKLAAEYLLKHDIPGIRYLDKASRKGSGGREGTSNIVLFDDKLVKITKKE